MQWTPSEHAGLPVYAVDSQCVYWASSVLSGLPVCVIGFQSILWTHSVCTWLPVYTPVQKLGQRFFCPEEYKVDSQCVYWASSICSRFPVYLLGFLSIQWTPSIPFFPDLRPYPNAPKNTLKRITHVTQRL